MRHLTFYILYFLYIFIYYLFWSDIYDNKRVVEM